MANKILGVAEVQVRANLATLKKGFATARKQSEGLVAGMRASFTKLRGTISGITNALRSVGVLGGVGLAGAAASVVAVTRKSIDLGDELGKTSRQIGISAEELQRLRHAADLGGVGNQELSQSLRLLNRNIGDAASGFGEGKRILDQYGISVKNADGTTRALSPVLFDIADLMAGMSSQAEKASIAQGLLGRAGQRLIPLLVQGSDAIRAQGRELDDFNALLSNETVAASEQAKDELTRLSTFFRINFTRGVLGGKEGVGEFVDLLDDPETRQKIAAFGEQVGAMAHQIVNALALIPREIARFKRDFGIKLTASDLLALDDADLERERERIETKIGEEKEKLLLSLSGTTKVEQIIDLVFDVRRKPVERLKELFGEIPEGTPEEVVIETRANVERFTASLDVIDQIIAERNATREPVEIPVQTPTASPEAPIGFGKEFDDVQAAVRQQISDQRRLVDAIQQGVEAYTLEAARIEAANILRSKNATVTQESVEALAQEIVALTGLTAQFEELQDSIPTATLAELTGTLTQQIEQQEELVSALGLSADEHDRVAARIEAERLAREANLQLTDEEISKLSDLVLALGSAQAAYEQLGGQVGDSRVPFQGLTDDVDELSDPLNFAENAVGSFGDAAGNAFAGIAQGSETAGDAFANFVRQLVLDIATAIAKIIALKLALAAVNYVTGGIGGLIGGAAEGASLEQGQPTRVGERGTELFARPSLIGPPAPPGLAEGGPLSRGQLARVSERGAELFAAPAEIARLLPGGPRGLASQRTVAQGRATLLGESGPGLFVPPTDGVVVPAEITRQILPGLRAPQFRREPLEESDPKRPGLARSLPGFEGLGEPTIAPESPRRSLLADLDRESASAIAPRSTISVPDDLQAGAEPREIDPRRGIERERIRTLERLRETFLQAAPPRPAFTLPPVPRFEAGGPVSAGNRILVGDGTGPELFVGESPGASIPAELLANLGGRDVEVNVINQTGAPAEVKRTPTPSGDFRLDILVKGIVKQGLGEGEFDASLAEASRRAG